MADVVIAEAEMPVLHPEQRSPDITDFRPQVRPQYRISEAHCERAVFIWELHDATFPVSSIPPKLIINPEDPDRDSSTSILELTEKVPSGRFIRGQEIDKPVEWQLYLQKSAHTNAAEIELQLALKCEKIYIQPHAHVLAKVSCEIVNKEGAALWSSGDVYDNEVKPFVQGTLHTISLGRKAELQNNRAHLINNGILRFRLKLNIYKEMTPAGGQGRNNSVNEDPPAKRRRLETGMSSGLSGLLCSLESYWKNKQQTGDITIKCAGQDIKAHRFILSGQSEVFMEMLDGKMDTIEKSSGIINVDDISPETIAALLEFLYLDDTSRFDWANVDQICNLIYAADKYLIAPLMTKCFQNLISIMNLDNFAKIAEVAFKYNSGKQFKDEVRHFYESNQITLNDVKSFRKFAHENFYYFHKLFFHMS